MKVEIRSILECPVADAWEAVQNIDLLKYVSAPLVVFIPLDPPSFARQWDGKPYLVKMRLFGLIPMGKQKIVPSIEMEDSTPGSAEYHLRDNGSGSLAKRWDHMIVMKERPDGRTDYLDRVVVEAGVLTPSVWAFASVFYRHRQRRWRKLAKLDFKL